MPATPVSLLRVGRLFGPYRRRLSALLALIFLSAGLGISLTLGVAGIRGLTWAIAPAELRKLGRTGLRLAPAFAISLAAHLVFASTRALLGVIWLPAAYFDLRREPGFPAKATIV